MRTYESATEVRKAPPHELHSVVQEAERSTLQPRRAFVTGAFVDGDTLLHFGLEALVPFVWLSLMRRVDRLSLVVGRARHGDCDAVGLMMVVKRQGVEGKAARPWAGGLTSVGKRLVDVRQSTRPSSSNSDLTEAA